MEMNDLSSKIEPFGHGVKRTRIFPEWPTATANIDVLPDVFGPRTLRRTG